MLNRPDYGNALTRSMVQQLVEALDDLYLEKRVRAIILTGAGDSFCVGADVGRDARRARSSTTPRSQWGADAADFRDLLVRMLEITKPIIAAVNGPALAAGAALVAAADIVVASDAATFGLPEPATAWSPAWRRRWWRFASAPARPPGCCSPAPTIDAAEAHRIGLFHELAAPDLVWARAMQLAERVRRRRARGDPAHQAAAQRNAGREPGHAALDRRRHDRHRPHHRSRRRRPRRPRRRPPAAVEVSQLGTHRRVRRQRSRILAGCVQDLPQHSLPATPFCLSRGLCLRGAPPEFFLPPI